jgi:hypothetical protein
MWFNPGGSTVDLAGVQSTSTANNVKTQAQAPKTSSSPCLAGVDGVAVCVHVAWVATVTVMWVCPGPQHAWQHSA